MVHYFIKLLILFAICGGSKNQFAPNCSIKTAAANFTWPLTWDPTPPGPYSDIYDDVDFNYTVTTLYGNDTTIPDSVKLTQFNEDDLNNVVNDTLFQSFANHFANSQADDFTSNICADLQSITQSVYVKAILSIYYPALTNFEKVRCSPGSCNLEQFWNSTNQNGSNIHTYVGTLSYVLFPLFLFVLIIFSMFSFMNCMYFNYCYCMCFDFTETHIKPVFFRILFVFVAIFSLLYIAVGVFNEYRFSVLTEQRNYFMCQMLSVNVYMLITGINATQLGNKDTDKYINWNGLSALNVSYQTYMSEFLQPFKAVVSQNSDFGLTDPVDDDASALYSGLNTFSSYISSTNFSFPDPNAHLDPHFNKIYTCSWCKNLNTSLVAAYNEINTTLYVQKSDYAKFRMKIYSLFVSPAGWGNVTQMHNNTLIKIRESIYRSLKFYNTSLTYYNSVGGTFDFLHYAELFLFALNTIVCCGGIFGYYLIEKAVEGADDFEMGNVYQFQDVHQRNEMKIQKRWTFHAVININMFTSMALCLYSIILLFLGVYIYEYSITTEDLFYNNNTSTYMMKNFSFISNGPLIDYCQQNHDLGSLFNLTDYYNFYLFMIDYADNLQCKYNTPLQLNISNTLNSQINSLTVASYIDINDQTTYWDPNDEQINYWLDYQKSYKFFPTPLSVLRQYTDFNFSSYVNAAGAIVSVNNLQKQNCGTNVTQDWWVPTLLACGVNLNYSEPGVTFSTYIDSASKACLPIDTALQNTACQTPLGCADVGCYTGQFMSRYTQNNGEFQCTTPNYASSMYVDMQSKIGAAKNASVTKASILAQIAQLQTNFATNFYGPLQTYQKKLTQLQGLYTGLSTNFTNIAKQFVADDTIFDTLQNEIDKNGILRISNCSKINILQLDYVGNNTFTFHYAVDDVSQELFGIALTTLALSIFLFLNGALVVVAFFKLRTYREIEIIKFEKETIKEIEKKDLRFFFRANNYIDSEDFKKYNEINGEKPAEAAEAELNKNETMRKKKRRLSKNISKDDSTINDSKTPIAHGNPYHKKDKPEDVLIDEQKKYYEEEKKRERSKFHIVYEFIDINNKYLDDVQKKVINDRKGDDGDVKSIKSNLSEDSHEVAKSSHVTDPPVKPPAKLNNKDNKSKDAKSRDGKSVKAVKEKVDIPVPDSPGKSALKKDEQVSINKRKSRVAFKDLTLEVKEGEDKTKENEEEEKVRSPSLKKRQRGAGIIVAQFNDEESRKTKVSALNLAENDDKNL